MRIPIHFALCLPLVAACSKTEKTTDSASGAVSSTAAATPAAAPAAAPLKLADVAGKWTVVATPTDGADKKPTTTTITATADTTGWTQSMPGHAAVPMHVRVDGDSIITSSGPYDSFRRKGVKVTTEGVYRMQGGKLVGSTTAHYAGVKTDSLIHLTSEGTKAP